MRKSSAFPPIDGLVDLACRDGVDIRPTLLRVLTDLYVQKPGHSADEEAQFVELVLGLIDAVDEATRGAVALRLENYPAAPAAILRKLGRSSAAPQSGREADNELVELFFTASAEERRLILTNLDAVAPARRAPVPADVVARLESAALNRNPHDFARMLERALGVTPALAERVTNDASGEPIVVAARAIGMKAAVLQRVLLFLNAQVGQSVERVYDLARLYDEITPDAAERMVSIWRQADRQKPRHEPLHWDDVHRSARSHASHGGHRVARRRDLLPSRIRSGDR